MQSLKPISKLKYAHAQGLFMEYWSATKNSSRGCDGFCFEECLNTVRLLRPSLIHPAWKSTTLEKRQLVVYNNMGNSSTELENKTGFSMESSVTVRIRMHILIFYFINVCNAFHRRISSLFKIIIKFGRHTSILLRQSTWDASVISTQISSRCKSLGFAQGAAILCSAALGEKA